MRTKHNSENKGRGKKIQGRSIKQTKISEKKEPRGHKYKSRDRARE